MNVTAPARPSAAPAILAFLAAALALRLVLIFATGFCEDEAYVIAISRAPALSYYDHPPLHQWLLSAWRAAFGEGRAVRLPFLGFNLLTSLALFGLTRRLFDSPAAWWALFAFNASACFLIYPDGYVTPDPPLLAFCALGAWAVAEILYGPPGRETPLWLAAGLALGLAGLSKYSAVFAPLGLAGFFLSSARARRWLADPRPYAGAALGLACLTPVGSWNAEHGWVSLAFQSGRAAHKIAFGATALREVAQALGEQAAAMGPWMLPPLLAGLAGGFRGGADSPQRLLLWLALPPLALFALMPLIGQRPLPHWFDSGWLFAFPLAGRWLAERAPRFRSRFFAISAGFAGVVGVGYLALVLIGPTLWKGARDPTLGMVDLPEAPLRAAYARAGADFVLIDNWRLGGKVGVALGPQVPICAMGEDPRGFAFACDASRRIGETALIVGARDKAGVDAGAFFASVEPLGDVNVGRRGRVERVLTLQRGRDLKRAPPLPYGP
jgi:4-amino-4-deoxy-L-arabinose transferase-like glycosyltransferase